MPEQTMVQKFITAGLLALTVSTINATAAADTKGGISADMLGRISSKHANSPSDKALRNALNGVDINKLAVNADNQRDLDTNFSHRVNSKGITNQKSSGRCWLFTGLNVLRAQMMAKNDMPELYLSQNYNFFYDQLEKANLFLQAMIDKAGKPMEDKTVEWLFKNPLSDGGQYTGISDNILKYGVVPASVMPETNSSDNTGQMRNILMLKLREYGLELRRMKAAGKRIRKSIPAKRKCWVIYITFLH